VQAEPGVGIGIGVEDDEVSFGQGANRQSIPMPIPTPNGIGSRAGRGQPNLEAAGQDDHVGLQVAADEVQVHGAAAQAPVAKLLGDAEDPVTV
jgi:hypothetical protein